MTCCRSTSRTLTPGVDPGAGGPDARPRTRHHGGIETTQLAVPHLDPPYLWPAYRSTEHRAPRQPLVPLPHGPTERHGPVFGAHRFTSTDADLTRQHDGAPLGERINVHGYLLDGDGRPIAGQLVEIWQANSAGRYAHEVDQHPAPLDPNFAGGGRTLDRRRRPLPLHHDQARRLPVAQPPQRLASRPHPLLRLRPGLHRAPRHPDVLPGRSPDPRRPDLARRARRRPPAPA